MIWETVVTKKKYKFDTQIKKPTDLLLLFTKKERRAQQEMFWVVTVNGQNIPTSKMLVSVGTLNKTLMHPREVLYHCITLQAAAFFIVHNHPSSSLTPSKEDIDMVSRLKGCGELLGIQLLDSMIITKDNYVSMREQGFID